MNWKSRVRSEFDPYEDLSVADRKINGHRGRIDTSNGDRLLTGEASVRNRLGGPVTSVQKVMQWGI
jgi:hypothetical protein